MSENKRYYWLKLKKDFFEQKMIKILRTFENGDRMITIFLKMELHSLENTTFLVRGKHRSPKISYKFSGRPQGPALRY